MHFYFPRDLKKKTPPTSTWSFWKTLYTWVENSAQETCSAKAVSKYTPKWSITLRPSARQRACGWWLCWRPLPSVTCIHWSERNSFLLLLHLSRWNVPLHSRGGGYQNNLAYIPRITQWSMCIELRGNSDPIEKDKLGWVARRKTYFHFQRLSESQE